MSSIQSTITATSPGSDGTVIHTETFTNLDRNDHCKIICTVQGGTGGTLNIYLQGYDGTQWFDVAALPQLADGAAVRTYTVKLDRRANPIIITTNITTIGIGGTPALAAGSVDSGDFGDRLRIVFVAGAGTSAGTVQAFSVFAFIDDLQDLEIRHYTALGLGRSS